MPHGLAKLGPSLGKALGWRQDRRSRILIVSRTSDKEASARIDRCASALRTLDIDTSLKRGDEIDRQTLRGCSVLVIAGGESELRSVLVDARSLRIPIVFLCGEMPFETDALNAQRMQRLRTVMPGEFARFETELRKSQSLLAAADFVIAPSPFLVERAIATGKNAFLVRDVPHMTPATSSAAGGPAGADGRIRRLHYFPRGPYPERDLGVAASAIAQLFTKRNDVALHISGRLDLAELPELRGFTNRVSLSATDKPLDLASSTIAAGDIVIDPAAADPWSDSRSALLFAEAGALGVPFIASPTVSYQESVADSETGFLCASPEEWHATLDRLLSDSTLHERIARNAQDVVREGFNEALQIDEFGQCFETVLGRVALRPGRFIPLVKRGAHSGAAEATRYLRPRSPVEEKQLPSVDVSVVLDEIADLRGFAENLAAQFYPPERLGLLIASRSDLSDTDLERALEGLTDRFARIVPAGSRTAASSAGHNRNLKNASADLFLVTDARIRLEPAALVRAAWDAIGDESDVAGWQLRERPVEDASFYDPVTLETASCSPRCQLFRRSAFRIVGAFKQSLSAKDAAADIASRLRKAGHRLRYNPAAVAWTTGEEPGGSPSSWVRFAGRARHLLSSYDTARPAEAEHEVQRGPGCTVGRLRHPERLASIIVRVHGRNRPICAEALTTLARQTYRSLEVIVVEHGGNLCAALCDRFRAEGLRVRHIVNSEGGRARSGNVGLEAASGSYLGFLDYDDLLMADHVETLVHVLERAPESLVAAGKAWGIHTHYRFRATDFDYREVFYREFRPDVLAVGERELGLENVVPIQSVLFRREIYERLGGMDESLGGYEDWELWLRYASAGDFVVVPKMTSLFRIRGMGPHTRSKVERQTTAAAEIRKRHASGTKQARALRTKGARPSAPGPAL